MYQVGILSRPGHELANVRAELSKHAYFKLHSYTDAPNAVSALKENAVSGMIVILREFNKKHLGLIVQIRQFHKGLPLIFLAEKIDEEAQKRAMSLTGTIALYSGADTRDLGGILLRMIQGHKVQNRTNKRSRTIQIASIQTLENSLRDQACLLDLASQGARMRSFKEIYNVGDKVRVEVPLTYLRKTYVVEAEIVWKKRELVSETHPTESWLAGIKFNTVLG